MQPPTMIAAAADSGRFPSPVTIALGVAAIGYVLWSRMQGQPLVPKRLIVLPAVLLVLGISDLTGSHHQTGADIGFLVGGALLSGALGAARGSTIELFARDGVLWQRYRPVTVALWVALILSKIVLAVIASATGAKGAATNGLLFTLGVSLLAESATVGPRALATHIPLPDPTSVQ